MATAAQRAAQRAEKREKVLAALAPLGTEREKLRAAQRANRNALRELVHDGNAVGLSLREMGKAARMTSEGIRGLLDEPRAAKARPRRASQGQDADQTPAARPARKKAPKAD